MLEGGLELSPLGDSVDEPEVLVAGEGDADGLAADLAGPLVAGAAGAGATVLRHFCLAIASARPKSRRRQLWLALLLTLAADQVP